MVRVDPHPHLHRDRHVIRRRAAHRSGDDRAEQVALPGQRRTAALAGHLGHRAPEVEVDVIGAVLGDEQAHRGGGGDRVDAIELGRAGRLPGVVLDEPHRLRVPFDERARGHHFADVERGRATGSGLAELPAQPTEGPVGDPRHRGEHDRRGDRQRTERQGREHRAGAEAGERRHVASIVPALARCRHDGRGCGTRNPRRNRPTSPPSSSAGPPGFARGLRPTMTRPKSCGWGSTRNMWPPGSHLGAGRPEALCFG